MLKSVLSETSTRAGWPGSILVAKANHFQCWQDKVQYWIHWHTTDTSHTIVCMYLFPKASVSIEWFIVNFVFIGTSFIESACICIKETLSVFIEMMSRTIVLISIQSFWLLPNKGWLIWDTKWLYLVFYVSTHRYEQHARELRENLPLLQFYQLSRQDSCNQNWLAFATSIKPGQPALLCSLTAGSILQAEPASSFHPNIYPLKW